MLLLFNESMFSVQQKIDENNNAKLEMCKMKKKKMLSLELVIFVILIHLINAIQQTVHTGLSRERWQGHLRTPALTHHLMQVHGKGNGNHLLLV